MALGDPTRTNYTGTFDPSQSPVAVAAGDPTVALGGNYYGTPATAQPTSSYVGQETGSVTPGSSGFLGWGSTPTQITAPQIPTLADQPDQAATDAAMAQYQKEHDQYTTDYQDLQSQMADARDHLDTKKMAELGTAFKQKYPNGEPKPPDPNAIQAQTDRARLLSEASGAYQPLINSLLGTATGTGGPTAADQAYLSTYQKMADDAQRRAMGMAASARGTGGQRAATFQSALQTAAQGQQQAAQGVASDLGKIKAQEQQAAGSTLSGALQGLTNLYGSQLLTDTRGVQNTNLGQQANALDYNAGQVAGGVAASKALGQGAFKVGATALGSMAGGPVGGALAAAAADKVTS